MLVALTILAVAARAQLPWSDIAMATLLLLALTGGTIAVIRSLRASRTPALSPPTPPTPRVVRRNPGNPQIVRRRSQIASREPQS